jgi:hypothetical protein
MKPYDTFNIKPETYDMKSKEEDKPKAETTGKKESKTAAVVGKGKAPKKKFGDQEENEDEESDEGPKLKKQDQG